MRQKDGCKILHIVSVFIGLYCDGKSLSFRLAHTGGFGCKFTKKSLNVYNTKKALNSTKKAFCIVQNVHRGRIDPKIGNATPMHV